LVAIENKKYEILFGIFLIYAILIRFQNAFHENLWPDEVLYAWSGLRIFQHPALIFSKEIIAWHPPFFPILIALVHIFMPSEVGARIVSPLLGSLGILLIYLIGARLKNRFVGVFAGGVLAFNFLHLFCSQRILIDAPLTTLFSLLMLVLIKFGMAEETWQNVLVGVIAFLTVSLKLSGLMVVPMLISYYLLLARFNRLSFNRTRKPLAVSLLVTGTLVVVIFLNNYLQLGNIFADMSALISPMPEETGGNYFVWFDILLGFKYLLPFFLYGLFILPRKQPVVKASLYSWFGVVLIILSLFPTKTERYAMPLIPVMILITAIGIDETITIIFKSKKTIETARAVSVIFILFWGIYTYASVKAKLDIYANDLYVGLKEVGEWIKKKVPSGTVIIADSPRHVRYYTGINYSEFGGRIVKLSEVENKIEELINQVKEPLYLEIDVWQWQKGVSPKFNKVIIWKRLEYFRRLGFRVVREVDLINAVTGDITPCAIVLKR